MWSEVILSKIFFISIFLIESNYLCFFFQRHRIENAIIESTTPKHVLINNLNHTFAIILPESTAKDLIDQHTANKFHYSSKHMYILNETISK